jgi:hypothetical protein
MQVNTQSKYIFTVYHPFELEEFPDEFDSLEEAQAFVEGMLEVYQTPSYSIMRWESGLGAEVFSVPDYTITLTFQIQGDWVEN